MDFGLKIHTWYDRHLRLWTAVYHNDTEDQIGAAGYGPSKAEAIADLKYQNPKVGKDNSEYITEI